MGGLIAARDLTTFGWRELEGSGRDGDVNHLSDKETIVTKKRFTHCSALRAHALRYASGRVVSKTEQPLLFQERNERNEQDAFNNENH
ncbi:hypothetical protein evm_001690 [Chilo suppressalis]|nr:hypothetical protein evm_001690 [Chilo suppressalis]